MDIEAVAEKSPEAIIKEFVNIDTGIFMTKSWIRIMRFDLWKLT